MDRIAVFVANYTIGNSPSIINLLDFLSDVYKVDLFLRSVELLSTDVLKKKNIKVYDVCGRKCSLSYIKEKIKAYFTLYNNYICFDPHGFVFCKELFPKSKPFYYSLEVYMKDDYFGLNYPKEIMEKERNNINNIKGLIIQSLEKESLFRKDYNLASEIPSLIIPVTYKGPSVKEKSLTIRRKYNIADDKKIALHLGGIAEWFSCIELAIAFSKINNWMLFFQGYSDREYLKKLKYTINKNNISNVIISEETYDSLEDVDKIIMSCDLGIAWYNDISIGFRTAGKSSGKIAAYLRFGQPIIAKKYPSTVDAIEKTGCGVCVDNFDEIGSAVSQIDENFDEYSKNALSEYDRTYWFENYKKEIIDFINNGS